MVSTVDRNTIIYHGEGVRTSEGEANTPIQHLVQVLLHGARLSRKIFSPRLVKAIFIKHDRELMREFRQELQKELDSLAENPPQNDKQEIIWRAFLGNIIAILPYTYPDPGHVFAIPVLVDGVCHKVAYHTEIIPLTYYSNISSPMIALGLTPQEETHIPSIFVYLGTTYPTGSGFAASLLANFTPGHSIGEAVYHNNRQKIEDWLKDKKGVHVIGVSLGGAIALNMLRDHHDKLARVDAYVPTGLQGSAWRQGISDYCKVNIYCQPNDIISGIGHWPTGDNVSLYLIVQHQEDISKDIISSHARAFTGCRKITVIKLDPKEQNSALRRKFLTSLHQVFGPFVVFLPVSGALLLYRLLYRIGRVSSGLVKR